VCPCGFQFNPQKTNWILILSKFIRIFEFDVNKYLSAGKQFFGDHAKTTERSSPVTQPANLHLRPVENTGYPLFTGTAGPVSLETADGRRNH
jgi:hypothetical protein